MAEKIVAEIRKQGPISLARFMELALYCPVYGYYEKEGDKIGRRGDYYTSVSVGSLFGELLACQFAEWLEEAPGSAECQESGVECHVSGQQGVEGGGLRGEGRKSKVQSPKPKVSSLKSQGQSLKSEVSTRKDKVPGGQYRLWRPGRIAVNWPGISCVGCGNGA